ncbi:histidine N-acetyltransferase-like [Gigantopelta aegis]|uniref:histidine N-acetyltransferase-like n=1 Tax=Gigantopelta aegis TaxID=1735272 RepID=UPI001B88A8B0|nr:histidine N-acetyltransferase-like [Gigantopelta aegis]
MGSDFTFREATISDYHDVMAIGEVYNGVDYLPSRYEDMMRSHNHTGYVSVVNGEIVAFVAACIVDNGETLVTRAGRVNDKYRGQGVYGSLLRFARKQIAAVGGVKYEAFTTLSKNFEENKDKIKAVYTEILIKNAMYYRSRFKIKDFKALPNDLNTMPTLLQKADLENIFSSDATCKHLFKSNRIVCGWVPFRLLSSNIDYILKPDTLLLASCRHDRSNNDVIYTCLTAGMHTPCKLGLVYSIDIFGGDVSEVRHHIQVHAKNLQSVADDRECAVTVMWEDNLLPADVESILNGVDMAEPTRAQAGKLYLLEKQFQ